MGVGIGLVFELAHKKPAVLLGKLDRLGQHAAALECGRRQDNSRTQKTHQLASLEAEALGHRNDQRVVFLRTDHGQADARIAARCFDDGLARLQCAAFFRVFDDAEREPVFDRAHRVERLDLDENVDVVRSDLVQLDDRRIANGLENVVKSPGHRAVLAVLLDRICGSRFIVGTDG